MTTDVLEGIIIDASHLSAADLDVAILHFAAFMGYEYVDTEILDREFHLYQNGDMPDDFTDVENFFFSFQEDLAWQVESAVDWLNDRIAADNYYFMVDDNSLYYWKVDDEND